MNRLRFLLSGLALLAAALVPASPSRASAFDVKTSGTVISYSANAAILDVNTRLGSKEFLTTTSTLVLLNNHSAATSAITAGDQVTVTFDYRTSVASVIHLTREVKITALVTAAGTNSLTVKYKGAALTFTTNANSVVDLNNIPITNHTVLVGQRATFIYEPGTSPLLLSMDGSALVQRGTISAVNTTAGTVTLAGKAGQTFKLDPNATLLRGGTASLISDLAVGDTLKVAYVRGTTGGVTALRALALSATAAPVVTATKAGKGKK